MQRQLNTALECTVLRPLELSSSISLQTEAGELIGTLRVAKIQDGWVSGPLEVGPSYAKHQPLFAEWTSCVNLGTFSCLDAIDEQINALRMFALHNGQPLDAIDIQIYDECGSVSCAVRLPD